VVLDITERKELEAAQKALEAELIASGRVVALGFLAAGVVHEINNNLTVLLSNLELLALQGEEASMVEDSVLAARQIQLIAKDLRIYSHKTETRLEAVNLREVVLSSLRLVAPQVRGHVLIESSLQQTPQVLAAESALAQVLLSLLILVAQSAPVGNPHTITVRSFTSENNHAVLEVEDKTLELPAEGIFEPFGTASGFGLFVSRNIIRRYGGSLTLESRPGCRFRLSLPGLSSPIVQLPKEISPQSAQKARILLIEADRAVAKAIARMARAQHEVVVCHATGAAFDKLMSGAQFELILCEQNMPGLSGEKFFALLQQHIPNVCVRFCLLTAVPEWLEPQAHPVLHKPVTRKALLEFIDHELQRIQEATAFLSQSPV
jgi:CheY-like chemotaxis protein/two-component sensor histidine kinase